MGTQAGPALDELRAGLRVIECDLDAGRYRPGPWSDLIRKVRNQPDDVRATLAADISRVSRKLNLRTGRSTIAIRTGIALELSASAVGGVVLAFAIAGGSNAAAIAAMVIWVVAFQPPVKVAVGSALGIGYDYAYLFGIEPRFKMSFGSYIAAARWKRIVLHLSGMAGSPLGATIVAVVADARLPLASTVCWAVFWITTATNLLPMIAVLFGVRRLGPFRAGEGSGGAAAVELREALGLSP